MSYNDIFEKRRLAQKSLEKWQKDKCYQRLLNIIRSELSPELAEIYELRERDKMTFPQIAKFMGLTIAQVVYKHNRARKLMDNRRKK